MFCGNGERGAFSLERIWVLPYNRDMVPLGPQDDCDVATTGAFFLVE